MRLVIVLLTTLQPLVAAAPVRAQQGDGTVVIDGSPPPEPPDTITRDARGRATVRAIKLTEPLRLDGVLDEAVYGDHKPFGGLLQLAPNYGQESTERTDVWITYDSDNIYV